MTAGIRYRIGIDIGGTFTDLVFLGGDGSVHTKKVSTTPDDYGSGIVAGVETGLGEIGAAATAVDSVVHATTVATNAILEGRGARTALVTTEGFRDVLEMRRLRIPEMYTLNFKRPDPLVPRNLRFEVAERIGPTGEIWRELNEASLAAVVARLADAEVDSVAICLLHSYANPAHELRVADAVRTALPRSVFVTCSGDILPEIREYERTSTTVINAYLGPILERYFASLRRNLARIGIAAPIHVMKSDGGIMTIAAAMRKPAYIVESGPSAGVIGAARLARRASLPDTITLDMGGTTAKAAMVERGEVAKTSDYEVGAGINLSSRLVMGGGHALKLPVIDISEIGAGGGSIVALDRSGALRVGPKSAGAQPGPVAYDNGGTEPTLTDAMIVLGYINGDHLVGGELRLDRAKAAAALQVKIATPIGKPLLDVAYGIYAVAAGTMVRAVKAVSTYRGRDPRDFALFAFGGNGPVLASEIATLLEMTRIVVPLDPGVFSAVGLLHADIAHERTQGFMKLLGETTPATLEASYVALERDMRALMAEEGCDPAAVETQRLADLRYDGQAHELTIAIPDGGIAALTEAFGREHERTYGHQNPANAVECVNLRIVGSVAGCDAVDYDVPAMLARRPRIVPEGTMRDAYFGPIAGLIATPVIERRDLLDRPRSGPLIVEEYDATTIVPPFWHAALDGSGNIVMTRQESA
jgi:N-methylhydantoinase A